MISHRALRRSSLRGLLGVVLASCAVPVAADTFSVQWAPVSDPELSGYRLHVRAVGQPFERDFDLDAYATALSVDVLEGRCQVYCLSLQSLGYEGEVGPSTPELCGAADPEIHDVALVAGGLRILGDNFTETVEVFVDGGAASETVTREDCGSLWIPTVPNATLRVENPDDGVGQDWSLPAPGYLASLPDDRTVLFRCSVDGDDGGVSTVSMLSMTPGMGLSIDADLPGIGTPCAQALAQILALPGMGRNDLTQLPLGDEGSLFLFTD